jgi:hypothetical protein
MAAKGNPRNEKVDVDLEEAYATTSKAVAALCVSHQLT